MAQMISIALVLGALAILIYRRTKADFGATLFRSRESLIVFYKGEFGGNAF